MAALAVDCLRERPPTDLSRSVQASLAAADTGWSRHPSVVSATTASTPTRTPAITARRLRGSRSGPRSIHGSSASTRPRIVGMTIAPTTSSLPGKVLQQLEQPEEYHSGRGMYVASVGSAGPSIAGIRRHASDAQRGKSTTTTTSDVSRGLTRIRTPSARRCAARTGPEIPCSRISHEVRRRRAPARSAGRKITCAEYQRVSVSAPIAEPPCRSPQRRRHPPAARASRC